MAHIDVTESSFEAEVIRKSYEVPVVVDFWAPWCAPCRTLGPVLEHLADEANGDWILAKVNSDEAPQLSTDYRIQGIPNVKAFVNGKVVDEFTGALPKHLVETWLQKIIPSSLDKDVLTATGLMNDGMLDRAKAVLEAVHHADPKRADARLGLAKIEALSGRRETAEEIFSTLTEYDEAQFPKEFAEVWILIEADKASQRGDATSRLKADPKDIQARWDLAMSCAAKQEYEPALEQLMAIFKANRAWEDEKSRVAMIRIFKILGDDDPRTVSWRSELGRWMY